VATDVRSVPDRCMIDSVLDDSAVWTVSWRFRAHHSPKTSIRFLRSHETNDLRSASSDTNFGIGVLVTEFTTLLVLGSLKPICDSLDDYVPKGVTNNLTSNRFNEYVSIGRLSNHLLPIICIKLLSFFGLEHVLGAIEAAGEIMVVL
jgi:hypothetical protein